MANFETFMVAPLLAHRPHAYTFDVFLHANVVSKITNARTNEANEALPGYVDWARFADTASWTFRNSRCPVTSTSSSARSREI